MIKTAKGSMLLGLALMAGVIFSLQPNAEALTTAHNLQLNNNSESNEPVRTEDQTGKGQDKSKKGSDEQTDKKKEEAESGAEEGTAFTATAYCLRGKTASGAYVRRGIVAADPKVIPLGSTIQISAGQYSGSYLVADVGGAVKGKKIDVWVPSCSEAIKFGRRVIKVAMVRKKSS